MSKMILHVFYACPHEAGEAFVREVKASGVYGEICKEEGCERYDYFFPAEGDGLTLIEQWRDEDALQKHSTGAPMAALKKIKAAYSMETTLEKFKAEQV